MNKVVNGATTRITLPFGNGHLGVDLGWVGGEGDNIYAHSEGVVTAVVTGRPKNNNTRGMDTYGNYVDIKHPNGYLTRYAHLSQVYVKRGDKVTIGTKIGYMGESGNTYGKHLHFEVRKPDGYTVDPVPFLRADLPNQTASSGFAYRVHLKDGNWLDWVYKADNSTEGYAGIYGTPIDGIQIKDCKYQAHLINGNWLDEVNKTDNTSSGYAGIYGTPIDGLKVHGKTYRVHIKGSTWLPWVSKVDDTPNGYAGLYGKEIDGIQIK